MKKIFIGIDFSKEKFDATVIKAEGVEERAARQHEQFDNKVSGFRRLLKWVRSVVDEHDTAPLAVLRREHRRLQQGSL